MNVEKHIQTSSELRTTTRSIIHLTLVHHRIQEELQAALKPFEVSLQQFNVLRILRGRRGEPANMFTINDRMVTKMSNTTRLVDKLMAKGYVSRQTCPSNRRKVEIDITPKGRDILLKMDKSVAESESHLLNALNQEELKQLNILLDKIKVK
ncbi:MarR family winged helix-turn-helix transcriptional regulator [Aureicoccus marinus]|jgi:DNA-binding MarR family transcriptional regulator|uniref:MarR family transcriptional regulator n=1 Tax=Aureicoccus marinus TaxID=754435 RepID=A0A2S7T6N2_9FLAO|nr:MarR family transcriptional regulator [Aureicoccus marinus]PQJ15579.1 MarR family transcriptional regulator [Aureicoccus marinus]